MQILQIIVVTLFFLSSGILLLLILIQSGKGGSMGILGGGSSSSAFGSSTVDVIEKATWWGILAFLLLAILSAIAFADAGMKAPPRQEDAPLTSESVPGGTQQPQAPSATNPADAAPAQSNSAPQ